MATTPLHSYKTSSPFLNPAKLLATVIPRGNEFPSLRIVCKSWIFLLSTPLKELN